MAGRTPDDGRWRSTLGHREGQHSDACRRLGQRPVAGGSMPSPPRAGHNTSSRLWHALHAAAAFSHLTATWDRSRLKNISSVRFVTSKSSRSTDAHPPAFLSASTRDGQGGEAVVVLARWLVGRLVHITRSWGPHPGGAPGRKGMQSTFITRRFRAATATVAAALLALVGTAAPARAQVADGVIEVVVRRRDQPGPAGRHRHGHARRHRLRHDGRHRRDRQRPRRRPAARHLQGQGRAVGLPDRRRRRASRCASARPLKLDGHAEGRAASPRRSNVDRRGAAGGRLQDRLLHQHRPRADPGAAGRRTATSRTSRSSRPACSASAAASASSPTRRSSAAAATPASRPSSSTASTSPTRRSASRARSSRQDAISEFRVITNRFDTEIGGSAGGALSIVTKSGTNDLQGLGLRLLPRRRAARQGRARPAEERLLAPAVRLHARRADRQGPHALLRSASSRSSEDNITLFRPGGTYASHAADIAGARRAQSLLYGGLDSRLNDKQNLRGRFVYERYRQENFRVGGVADETTGMELNRDNWNLTLTHNWTVSNTSLNQLSFQVGRRKFDEPNNSTALSEYFSSGNTLVRPARTSSATRSTRATSSSSATRSSRGSAAGKWAQDLKVGGAWQWVTRRRGTSRSTRRT